MNIDRDFVFKGFDFVYAAIESQKTMVNMQQWFIQQGLDLVEKNMKPFEKYMPAAK